MNRRPARSPLALAAAALFTTAVAAPIACHRADASPPSANAHAAPGSAQGVVGLPVLDAATAAHVRAVYALGAQRGQRAGVFAKLGDSITESASFLSDVGHGWYDLGPHHELTDTIAFFHRTAVDAEGNDSFARGSVAAVAGWTTDDALEAPAPTPVERELDAIHPAFSLIMFGTNDIDRSDLATFERNLGRIVDVCLARGVVPVVSTIPRRLDGDGPASHVAAFNARIAAVATARSIPLMDLNAALEPLPRHGVSADGIHPSAYTVDRDVRAATFTADGLRAGYNVRNLLALETLGLLRSTVAPGATPASR